MRILLVEDNELVRMVLGEVLSDAGHEVVEAAGPDEALSFPARNGAPELLITDVDLGAKLNGFDMAAHAHRCWPCVGVLLISGLPPNHTGQTLDPRDRYLQKPFSRTQLLHTVEELKSTLDSQPDSSQPYTDSCRQDTAV